MLGTEGGEADADGGGDGGGEVDLCHGEGALDFLSDVRGGGDGSSLLGCFSDFGAECAVLLFRLWLGEVQAHWDRPLGRRGVEYFPEDFGEVGDYSVVCKEDVVAVSELALGFEAVVFLFELFDVDDAGDSF